MPRYNSFFATSCCSIAVCDLLHCYKIQDTICIFRASVATLSGLSTEKSHEQVLLKSIKNMQVQVIRYMNAGDDEIETWITSHMVVVGKYIQLLT